mgnify:CR=1 FL=1
MNHSDVEEVLKVHPGWLLVQINKDSKGETESFVFLADAGVYKGMRVKLYRDSLGGIQYAKADSLDARQGSHRRR